MANKFFAIVNGVKSLVSIATGDLTLTTDKKFVTDAHLTILGNTSGTNTGDNSANSSSLALTGGIMTGGITNSTSVSPLTTLAESWIGPSSSGGVYFKGGNVGIGTTGPNYQVETKIGSNTYALGLVNSLTAANSLVGIGFEFGRTGGPGGATAEIRATKIGTGADAKTSLTFRTYGASDWVDALFLDYNGNVGIGTTTPTAKLMVRGAGTTTGKAFSVIDSSNVEKLTVLDSGNVGIGTTTPTAKLHLPAGTATASTAPLKMSTGVLNTIPEVGAIEFDGSKLWLTTDLIGPGGYTQKAIFGYGYTGSYVSMTNLVSNTGVVSADVTGVGTVRGYLAAAGYGGDKAIFSYGHSGSYVSMTNLVSNTGVVSADVTGVGTARYGLAAAGYGGDKAIFGYGYSVSIVSMTNLVSNTGVVSADVTGVGTARYPLAAAGYGGDKAIFGYGSTGSGVSMTNLVSNTGVVSADVTGVGTARFYLAAAGYSLS